MHLNNLQASVYAQKNLSAGQTALQQSVERLSSGLRVNRAGDNASNLAISQKVQSQVGAIAQGVKNASQAISVLQTAEGALSSTSDLLLRMKELAVQGRNGGLSAQQRSAISAEILQLRKEVNAIAERTTFNSNALLKNALSATVSAAALSNPAALREGADVLAGLKVENLDVSHADVGNYRLSFGTVQPLQNQLSRISTELTGLEGSDTSQTAAVGGSQSARTITLSGVFEAGDTIRYTVKGDSPDQTTVLTYTVTAENLTRNNDGTGGALAGGSVAALTNIAAGIAAQYNANNISSPQAAAAGEVITFSGDGLTSISVAAEALNRVDQSREVIVTAGDLGEGNRVVLTIDGKNYEYVVASDSGTEDVAEGLRQMVLADYPDTAVRAGSILTLESGSGLTVADIQYSVYRPADSAIMNNLASSVSAVQATSVASRSISINDFDVVAGRRFTITIGNPQASTTFSVIAGTDDDKTTIASKLASRLQQNFGSGGSGVSAANNIISFGAALGLGMSMMDLRVSDTSRGVANTVVGPAQGITAATWGVGGRLDDGVYEILYSEGNVWSVVRDPLPGSVSTFNGTVLTTSAGNQVNVTLSGTQKFGDRYFFQIQNGDPDRTLSRLASATAANGIDGVMGTTDDTVVSGIWNDTKAVAVAGGTGTISSSLHTLTYNSTNSYWTSTGTTHTATYDGASTVTVIDNPYRSVSASSFGLASGYVSGDQINFSVGDTGSPGSLTLYRSVNGSFSGGNYSDYFASGFWYFRHNGSSWIAQTGGSSSVSGSTVNVSGRAVGTLSGGREGDYVIVQTYSYYDNVSESWRYVSSQYSRWNEFNGSTASFTGSDPLISGSYSFSNNAGSWSATGSTPASATYNGSIMQNGSGGTGARVTQKFQIRRAETLDAETASVTTRTPLHGDQLIVDNNISSYLRVGTTGVRFAVAGILEEGDYILEYNGDNYSIKNAFGDLVLNAEYTTQAGTNWLILDPTGGSSSDDRVELDLAGTPQVGDKVYFTLTAGNVITNRYVNGSYLGGREDSVSSKFRDRSDRVISISDADLVAGRSVAIDLAGKEYAVLVDSGDDATSVARRLAGLIDDDYPNTTSGTQTPEFPAATRVEVSGNQITLKYPALAGIDEVGVSVRSVANPGLITLSKLSPSGSIERSQSIALGALQGGSYKSLAFDQLGVAFDLRNYRASEINDRTFSESVSKVSDLALAPLQSDPLFQIGPTTRAGDFSVYGLGDVRLNGANASIGGRKYAFDGLSNLIDMFAQRAAQDLSEDDFASLANSVENVITYVSATRSELGLQHNRIEHAILGIDGLSAQLSDVHSRLIEADMADEMARLVRIQIGQQAASAMLAQANLLPEVILSMLQAQPGG